MSHELNIGWHFIIVVFYFNSISCTNVNCLQLQFLHLFGFCITENKSEIWLWPLCETKEVPPNSVLYWALILLSHFVIIFVLFCFLVFSLFSCFVQVLYERLGGCYFFSSLILFIFCTKLVKSLVIILFFYNLLWILGRFYVLTFLFF